MADMEKVIKGLETCIKPGLEHCTSECPYFNKDDYRYECVRMKSDAIELLKEQGTIVRCKDCKYAVLTYQGELKYCKYFVDEYGFTNGGDPLYLEGDFFCAAGKRR